MHPMAGPGPAKPLTAWKCQKHQYAPLLNTEWTRPGIIIVGLEFGIIRGMEKIATDTYSFSDVRKGGFVYVDKTAILKTLADGSIGKQFFVARPRRFGKSLAGVAFDSEMRNLSDRRIEVAATA